MNFNRQVQTGVGIMVLIACTCLFLVLTFGSKNIELFNKSQNIFIAYFDEIGGLYVKAPVRIAGVTIGFAKNISIDPKNFRAIIEISVNKDIPIPVDSIIKIYTEGVLGSKYLAIFPGYDEIMMKDGQIFKQTESAVILEGLIAQLINTFSQEK